MQTLAFIIAAIAGIVAAYLVWRIVHGQIPAEPLRPIDIYRPERRNRKHPSPTGRGTEGEGARPPRDLPSAQIAQNATASAKLHLLMRRRRRNLATARAYAIPLAGALIAAIAYSVADDAPDNHATAQALDTARVTLISALAQCPEQLAGDTAIVVATLTSADAHTAHPYRAVHCVRMAERKRVIAAR